MGHRRGTQRVEIIEILTSDRAVVRQEPARGNGPTSHPAAVALVAIALLVVAALIVHALASDDHTSVKAPSTTVAPVRLAIVPSPTEDTAVTTVTVATGGLCSDDRVPFRATFLPYGWQTYGAVWSGVDQLTGDTGAVSAVHGPAVPPPGDAVSSVSVLGLTASIASTGDGFAVYFVLGSPSDLCDHWALVASRRVSAATLQRIAEGLTPFSPGTMVLECQRAYPQPEPDLGGRTVVVDSVALPTAVHLDTVPAHLPTGTLALFARETLLVKADAAFTIAVAPASLGRVALDWQGNSNTSPVTRVTVPGCGADTQWISFFGGFWVMSPQCATLLVGSAGVEQQVKVGIGMACP